MGTRFYLLKSPVTRLQLEANQELDKLSVWIDHELSGALMMPKGQSRDVTLFFVRQEPALYARWGGAMRGTVVTVDDPDLLDEMAVVSERGELMTVGEVKAKDRERRVA